MFRHHTGQSTIIISIVLSKCTKNTHIPFQWQWNSKQLRFTLPHLLPYCGTTFAHSLWPATSSILGPLIYLNDNPKTSGCGRRWRQNHQIVSLGDRTTWQIQMAFLGQSSKRQFFCNQFFKYCYAILTCVRTLFQIQDFNNFINL